MAWSFGDGFDLYTAATDAINGYWDANASTFGSVSIVAGRFTNSRAFSWAGSPASNLLAKTSNVNDAVHHIAVAFQQTATIGSAIALYLQLLDGTTGQCAIVFNRSGDIQLMSGSAAGTVLATYTGAFVANTWYHFEFEVVIHPSAGTFKVRKNGNSTEDFTATGLNTRGGTANNYANKLQINQQNTIGSQLIDDLYWKSDASSVAWLGDIRCYTRMPASDQSVVFSKSPLSATPAMPSLSAARTPNSSLSFYSPLIAAYDGTVSTVTLSIFTGFTGNLKCSVFNDTGSNNPGTVRSSATIVTNPVAGNIAITFPTPFTVVKGTQYWLGFITDVSASSALAVGSPLSGRFVSTVTYAAFPTATPTINSNEVILLCTWTISITTNNCLINEVQQDAATSYVYDSTPGDADFYGIATIGSTPLTTIAVTTRGYCQKSDAGTRTAAAQLKSGGTTVASPTVTLTTSGWQWAWRTDTVDPNTSSAWTAAAVNSAQIGPKVIA